MVIYEGGCYLLHSPDPTPVKVSKKRGRDEEVGSGLVSDPVVKQVKQKKGADTEEEGEESGEDDVGY
jgi:hypothetical protein